MNTDFIESFIGISPLQSAVRLSARVAASPVVRRSFRSFPSSSLGTQGPKLLLRGPSEGSQGQPLSALEEAGASRQMGGVVPKPDKGLTDKMKVFNLNGYS